MHIWVNSDWEVVQNDGLLKNIQGKLVVQAVGKNIFPASAPVHNVIPGSGVCYS